MLKTLFILFSIITITSAVFAQQNHSTVKGIIYDSINKIPLSSASIVFYNKSDSTINGLQITDYNGHFLITGLPAKTPMYYIVTFTGYYPFSGTLQIDSGNAVIELNNIKMKLLDSTGLEDVIVKSVAALKMNNDTLEINPEAFKLDSEAVVEDMLLRVPGMMIWADGTIMMNGKKIDNVLVDGKPFFGGQANIATQNLPKDAIEKVQLYQQKNLTKMDGLDIDKKDSLYSLNIRLKANKKKGTFGKLSAGYGTGEKHDVSGVLQGYNPKNQIGVAVGTDNINKTTGLGTNAFLENTFKQSSMSYKYDTPSINGDKKNIWGSTKFQHSFNESDNGQYYSRLSGDYTYTNTDLNTINSTEQSNNLITYIQHNTDIFQADNSTSTHDANLLFERKNKFGHFISINTAYKNDEANNNSTSTNNVFNNNTEVSFNDVRNYSRKRRNNVNLEAIILNNSGSSYKDNNSLKNYSLNVSATYNDNNSFTHINNIFKSYIDTIPSSTIVRNYNTASNDFNGSAS